MFISWDFVAWFFQGELFRDNLTENRVQSTGTSAAVHKTHLYGFSKDDRKQDMTRYDKKAGDFLRAKELAM